MSSCCGGTPHDPAAFACHGCGTCCTNLRTHFRSEAGRFAPAPAAGVYRLATPGGLRMFAWETGPFDKAALRPLLVVADGARRRLVALAYELDAVRCPRYAPGSGCTVYEDRPMVCRAFPLLVVDGPSGPEVAASALCPARVPVVVASAVADRPERVLAAAYPHEAAAALAVPALTAYLLELVSYLSTARTVQPVAGLDDAQVAAFSEKPPLDLVALLEETGIMTGDALRERAGSMRRRLHRRWVEADAAPSG